MKAKQEGRLREGGGQAKSGDRYQRNRNAALEAWAHIAQTLKASASPKDQSLAQNIMIKSSFATKGWSAATNAPY